MQNCLILSILALYVIPGLRLFLMVFKILPKSASFFQYHKWPKSLQKATQILSSVEYYFGPLRLLVVIGLLLYSLYSTYQVWHLGLNARSLICVLVTTLVLVFVHMCLYGLKTRARLRMIEFIRIQPQLHPKDFFDIYKRELAFGLGQPYSIVSFRKIEPQDADFRLQTRSRVLRLAVFLGFWDTVQCVKFCFAALQNIGPHYMFENADAIGSLAGKRILQYCQASFKMIGTEKLKDLTGKYIFIFNHESVLDFMLAPFALSQVVVNNRPVRTRFFVAKDHFRDNFFIYSILGFGKVVEALGMIFLNRKQNKESHQSMKDAAVSLVTKEIDLAIYPQGTRASAVYDRAGKRRGAGYYTTISKNRMNHKMPHLKKGVAHLVHEILLVLNEKNQDVPLNLVFIGIDGAAKVIPKSIWSLETESEIEFRVGDVMILHPHMLQQIYPEGLNADNASQCRKAFVDELMQHIDQRLVQVLQLPHKLSKRFFMDLKGQFRHFENDKLAQIEHALNAAAAENAPVYAILDCIYSLPVKEWNGNLAQFCQLLLMKPENDRFVEMLQQLSERLLK